MQKNVLGANVALAIGQHDKRRQAAGKRHDSNGLFFLVLQQSCSVQALIHQVGQWMVRSDKDRRKHRQHVCAKESVDAFRFIGGQLVKGHIANPLFSSSCATSA